MPADPKTLFYVTAAVLGLLVLWVGWVLATAENRVDLSALATSTAGAGGAGSKAPGDKAVEPAKAKSGDAKKQAVAAKDEAADEDDDADDEDRDDEDDDEDDEEREKA